jgi:heat shock protein HtpX
MSHVGNRDILIASVAATIAMAITLLSRIALFASIFTGGNRDNDGANIFELLALVILAPIAATLLQLALSRSREYEADRSGARLIGDGEPLARALAKLEAGAKQIPMPEARREMAPLYIVSPLAGMNVSFKNWFSDHPPTEDRIRRLRSREWAR